MTRLWLAAISVISCLCNGTALSAGEITITPHGAPTAFHRVTPGGSKLDLILEASGVEPIGDGSLALVAHDKSAPLVLAEIATGQIVADNVASSVFPKGLTAGPKWEGMAQDRRGYIYVIGAHNGKTPEERAQKSFLFRFKLKGDGAGIGIDDASASRWRCTSLDKALASQVTDPAKAALLKVEGLSIREIGGRTQLVVGLREPGDVVRAFVADVTETPSPESELEFKPLFHFQAGSREGVPSVLTSLHYLAAWKGFLVVTSTEDELNVFHGNTLWFVSDASIVAGKPDPIRISEFEPAMKAEGLAELPGATAESARLVIAYDNDTHTTKIPSRIQTVTITRKP